MSDTGSFDVLTISELLPKDIVNDTDILMVEDLENTKQVTFANLRKSLISDNENAANTRLWSSEKTQTELSNAKKESDKAIGEIKDIVEKVNDTAVTQAILDQAMSEMDNKKCDKVIVQAIDQQLENKRGKDEHLTFKDLSPTTEEEKLHLDMLGADVLSAMTGDTPVNPAVVPTGKWQTEDLADYIITAQKLATAYRFRKAVTDGNINVLTDDGLYLCGNTVTGLPKYSDDETDPKLLETFRYGENGKYIMQRVYYIDQQASTVKRPYRFERKGEVSKIHQLQFTAHFEVTEVNRVESDFLGATYNNRGTITSGLFTEITEAGNYYCTSDVSNLPIEGTDFLLTVNPFDNYTEYIAKTVEIAGGSKQYICFLYYDSSGMPMVTDWFQTSTDMKSKFGTKNVHVFGDGIAYGIGASVVGTTSFTGLLNSKYGYKIYNHSITDATFGVYGNDNMKERSIQTQIELDASISTAEYAIIFAGTNDYTCGVADIGTNNSVSDTTFKGSIVSAISKLLELNPSCKVLLVSPIYRASITAGDNNNGDDTLVNSKKLSEYVAAMKEISEYLHITFVDIYTMGTINKYNKDVYLNSDGIHPTDAGYDLICDKIHNAMCQYY